jgi:23S rRNA (guanine745-N1)-methyltransferase
VDDAPLRRRSAGRAFPGVLLRHRSSFLDAGHFGFITAAIAERLQHAQIRSAGGGRHVLDTGCGTGRHLASIAAALGPGTVGLGLDISAAAARLAARRCPGLAFAVADLWSDWPVQDAACDLVLNIFAPRNFAETARVLRPGGQHAEKARLYADAASRTIGPAAVTRIVRHTTLAPDGVRDIVLMGPSARHPGLTPLHAEAEPIEVTFDIAVLLARKRAPRKAQDSSRRGKG